MPSIIHHLSKASIAHQAFMGERISTHTWHLRLEYPSHKITSLTVNKFHLTMTYSTKFDHCVTRTQEKMHALSHLISSPLSIVQFELLFSDVWGVFPILSTNSYRYYLSIVDDYLKYI